MPGNTFQMLFLADSVMWGQGLAEEHKFSTKLVGWIHQWHAPAITASKVVFAHSGAVIGAGKPTGGLFKHGEVPAELPSILDQVTRYTGNPADIDLVVLNGGINDVGVAYIASTLTVASELTTEIQRYCHQDLTGLIVQAAQRFSGPNTRVLVTGYYPVLSPQSSVLGIPLLLGMLGLAVPGLPFLPGSFNPLHKVIDNFMLFWQVSRQAMQQAVQDANNQLGAARAVFVDPLILEPNAAFAPQSWVFGINPDLGPQDAVSGARRIVCVAQQPELLQRELCFRASAGHPNIHGADAYFRAIYPVLQNLYGL